MVADKQCNITQNTEKQQQKLLFVHFEVCVDDMFEIFFVLIYKVIFVTGSGLITYTE